MRYQQDAPDKRAGMLSKRREAAAGEAGKAAAQATAKYLDPEFQAEVVKQRAARRSWQQIANKLPCDRETASRAYAEVMKKKPAE